MSWSDRILRAVLRLLPSEFRGAYQREIESTFRAERRDAHGQLGLLRIWAATLADIVRTAPGEHLDILRRDLAYTMRLLARRPALTLTATLTLALGVGANTAIFSVVNGVLFSPLPYPDADRLVLVQEDEPDEEPGTTGYFSFDTIRSEQQTFDAVAAMSAWSAILAGDGKDAERVNGARVTWEFFRTLGVAPAIGRDFDRAEDHPDRRRVALLSDGLWRRRYGADPGVIGRPVTINQVTYIIAGVMPPALNELVTTRTYPETEIWTLLGYATTLPQACRTCRHIYVVGRVKRGVAITQAEADVTRIYQSLTSRFPSDYSEPRGVVTPVADYFLGPVKSPLLLLWGAVGILLLMACANIANLLLIRASEREEEIAIRRALGVSPARMLRQLLTEAVVLASIGGLAGAMLAWWGTALLAGNGPDAIPRLHEVAVNGRVLIYAIAISIGTGILFGMAPARMLLLQNNGVGSSRRTTATASAWRYRATLVTVNVALSALLLVGSGLLVRSFLRLLTVEPGFDTSNMLTMQMGLSGQAYGESPAITRFYDEFTARLQSLPGVVAVSASTQLPLTGSIDRGGITIEGRPLDNPAASPEADRYGVRPDYFSAMRIPLRRGRFLDVTDTRDSLPVAVIGETMAAQLWPGEDPIGRRIRVAGGPGNPMRTIVGIVGDVRHYGLHLPPTYQVYLPHTQGHYPEPMMSVVVRLASGDPLAIAGSVREQSRALDPLQPVTRMRTFESIVAESMAARRFTLVLLGLFAATALILAIVGLYGALSYVVSQRHREIGVRVALGAASGDIARLVIEQGMRPAGIGLAAGLALSLATGRLLETMLYGVTLTDAATLIAVLVVVGGSALAACLVPARRAAAIDPAVTLRSE